MMMMMACHLSHWKKLKELNNLIQVVLPTQVSVNNEPGGDRGKRGERREIQLQSRRITSTGGVEDNPCLPHKS